MTNTNRQPSHRLYAVKGEGEAASWIVIGAAWANKDQQGYTLQFDALPIGGRVVMREITAKAGEGGQP